MKMPRPFALGPLKSLAIFSRIMGIYEHFEITRERQELDVI